MVEQAKPLPNKRFDELAVLLRGEMARKGVRSTESGIDEFIRKSVTGEPSFGGLTYTYEEVVRFTHTYRFKKRQVSEALEGVGTDRGDDSHGDLCDSFPLLGGAWIEKLALIDSGDSTWKLIDREAKDKLPAEIYDLVFEGENYVHSRLEEHLGNFASSALQNGEVADPEPRPFTFRTGNLHGQQFVFSGKLVALSDKEAVEKMKAALSALKISFESEDPDLQEFEIHAQPEFVGKQDLVPENV